MDPRSLVIRGQSFIGSLPEAYALFRLRGQPRRRGSLGIFILADYKASSAFGSVMCCSATNPTPVLTGQFARASRIYYMSRGALHAVKQNEGIEFDSRPLSAHCWPRRSTRRQAEMASDIKPPDNADQSPDQCERAKDRTGRLTRLSDRAAVTR